jgi:hypothetical protein
MVLTEVPLTCRLLAVPSYLAMVRLLMKGALTYRSPTLEGGWLIEVSKRVAARQQRLAEFPGEGTPPGDVACELLCEDHVGATGSTLARWSVAATSLLSVLRNPACSRWCFRRRPVRAIRPRRAGTSRSPTTAS